MQRRELLEKLLNTALAMGLLTPLSLAAADANTPAAAPEPESGDAAESAQWLEQELRQLAALDSSEQSVPMFLALENLTADTAAATLAATNPDDGPVNTRLMATFERYADLLLQLKSHPDESDAVALIVLMARQELLPVSAQICR